MSDEEDDVMVTIEVAVTQTRYAYLSDLASMAGVSVRTTAGLFLEKGLKGDMAEVQPPYAFARSEEELLHGLAVVRAYLEDDYQAVANLIADHPHARGLIWWVLSYVEDAEERLAPRDTEGGRQALLDIVKKTQGKAVRRALATGHNGQQEEKGGDES